MTGHALGYQLLFETHPEFAKSPQAAGCPRLGPRLVPRKGPKPPVLRSVLNPAWTLWDSAYTETNDPRYKDPSGEFWIKQLDGTYLKQGA